ncbi:MAG: hypothetical protein ABL933_18175 [Methyloglobulus sp.]|nr:hypothetical protein [Methyloglobulus sp.]
MKHSDNNPQQKGFSYVEVLVATMLVAIALVPAMNALQMGIMGVNVHKTSTTEHFCRLRKIEELQAQPFTNLLAAAKVAANTTTATYFSDESTRNDLPCYDPTGDSQQKLRRLVYIALYDADADPFTIANLNDTDNDPYTGNTANLLWVKVITEGSAQGLETLISR